MPVELSVLSGKRLGESYVYDANQIVVASEGEADLAFPNEPGASDKRLVLQQDDNGWSVRNESPGNLIINSDILEPGGAKRLRSGDCIRLSSMGPDVRFEVAAANAAVRKPAPPVVAQVPPSAASESHTAAAEKSATAPVKSSPATSSTAPGTATNALPLVLGGAVAAVVLGLAGFGLLKAFDRTPVPLVQQAPITPPRPPALPKPAEPEPTPSVTTPTPDPAPHDPPPKPDPPPRDDALTPSELQALVRPSVVWLGVEIEGLTWPFCTGWAARNDTIVSSAARLAELEKFRAEGKRIVACYEDDKIVTIRDIRLHSKYQKDSPGAANSILHNIGVAILDETNLKPAKFVAFDKAPKPITDWKPLALAYEISSDDLKPINRAERPKPVRLNADVTGTTTYPGASLDDLPLLALKVDAKDGMTGGPLLDSKGNVVGLMLIVKDQAHGMLLDDLKPLIPDAF